MAHLIGKQDRTFSVKGKEWHGLAQVPLAGNGSPVDSLTGEIIRDILFPIIPLHSMQATVPGTGYPMGAIPPEVSAQVRELSARLAMQTEGEGANAIVAQIRDLISGVSVSVPGKTVAADLRHRGEGVIPLATHSDKYSVITNEQVFDAITSALKEFPHVITTAGTLDDCNRFYVTAQLKEGTGFNVGGEAFHGFLNFITSHDGSLACQAYDSLTRIVCNNTLQASLSSARHKVYIRHTKNSEIKMEGVADFIGDVLAGREEWANLYSRAKNTRLPKSEALGLIAAYFHRKTKGSDEMSTRTRNNVDSVFQLFQRGRGNDGETIGDVLNGFTEHYTHGEGTGTTKGGRTVTAFEKEVAGLWGSPADTKKEVARILLDADGREFQELVDLAPAALEAYGQGAGMRVSTYRPAPAPVAPAIPVAPSGVDDFAALLEKSFAPKA